MPRSVGRARSSMKIHAERAAHTVQHRGGPRRPRRGAGGGADPRAPHPPPAACPAGSRLSPTCRRRCWRTSSGTSWWRRAAGRWCSPRGPASSPCLRSAFPGGGARASGERGRSGQAAPQASPSPLPEAFRLPGFRLRTCSRRRPSDHSKSRCPGWWCRLLRTLRRIQRPAPPTSSPSFCPAPSPPPRQ